MLGATLLRLVTLVTPDDVKELKTAGCTDEAKVMLEALHRVAVHWQGMGAGKQEGLGWCPGKA